MGAHTLLVSEGKKPHLVPPATCPSPSAPAWLPCHTLTLELDPSCRPARVLESRRHSPGLRKPQAGQARRLHRQVLSEGVALGTAGGHLGNPEVQGGLLGETLVRCSRMSGVIQASKKRKAFYHQRLRGRQVPEVGRAVGKGAGRRSQRRLGLSDPLIPPPLL